MLGYGEVFFLLGTAALMFGPKDVPRIARGAGRLAGRAVGMMSNLRARAESAVEGAVLAEVHRDLRDGLTQLHAIGDEIRSGISPLSPGPLAQRALRQAREPPATPPLAAPPWPTPDAPSRGAAAAAASQPWSGSGAAASASRGTPGAAPGDMPFPFLPISAAALGRLPARRSGQPVTGADIMEEAVAEEAVGTQAARLVSVPGALDAAAYASQRKPEGGERT